MVFMRVGKNDRLDLVSEAFQIDRVRHDEVDAGRRVIAKRHAHIDDDPPPIIGRAITVGVEVHPDFPATAKGSEYEFGALHFSSLAALATLRS